MASHTRVGVASAEVIHANSHHEWAKKLWSRMDRNRNRRVSVDELNCGEFQDALRSIIAPQAFGKVAGSYSRAEMNIAQLLDFCMRKADGNHDGRLSLKEFESFTRELRNQKSSQDVTSLIFALFDLDGDQHIDHEEFRGIYRFYLGTHPVASELQAEWKRLDFQGRGRVTKEEFARWLPTARNPCFHQHAGSVQGQRSARLSLASSTGAPSEAPSPPKPARKKASEQVWRPAPGLVPRRNKASPELPTWNENFASKDPSEQNLAVRGNLLMKTYFSRPKSLPELRRFYKTYHGFEKNLQRLDSPLPPPPRKPLLSEETWDMAALPGGERHLPGGTARNARGEEIPWREQTPRALKPVYREPGTMLLRVPTGSSGLVTPWSERRQRLARSRSTVLPPAPQEGEPAEDAPLPAPRGRRPQDPANPTTPGPGGVAEGPAQHEVDPMVASEAASDVSAISEAPVASEVPTASDVAGVHEPLFASAAAPEIPAVGLAAASEVFSTASEAAATSEAPANSEFTSASEPLGAYASAAPSASAAASEALTASEALAT